MKKIHNWLVIANDAGALFCALVTNATLLHLIHRRTPEFLRPYAQILRIHCITDICCDLVIFLIGPQILPFNHRLHYLFNGIWVAKTPSEMMLQINIICGLAIYLPAFMVSMAADFQYKMSNRQLTVYATLVSIFSFLIGYPYFHFITRTDPNDITAEERAYFKRLVQTDTVPLMGINITTEPSAAVIILLFNFAVVIEYIFIGYAVRRITQTSRKQFGESAEIERITTTNRQITRILILQALVPLITFIPVCLTTTSTMLGFDLPMVGAVGCLVFTWFGVIRPAATILIIPCYKNCILRALNGGEKPRSTGIS